jgi:NAD+ synthase (glutamine-hydrolysing)
VRVRELHTVEQGRKPALTPVRITPHDEIAEVYNALVMGTHDYICKNSFRGVVVGLSGGIDSALVATIAVDALGADAVTGVSMPSRYSSEGSKSDAHALADNLSIKLITLPIERPFEGMLEVLDDAFAKPSPTRRKRSAGAHRGNLLMALPTSSAGPSSTGNKSELATGY